MSWVEIAEGRCNFNVWSYWPVQARLDWKLETFLGHLPMLWPSLDTLGNCRTDAGQMREIWEMSNKDGKGFIFVHRFSRFGGQVLRRGCKQSWCASLFLQVDEEGGAFHAMCWLRRSVQKDQEAFHISCCQTTGSVWLCLAMFGLVAWHFHGDERPVITDTSDKWPLPKAKTQPCFKPRVMVGVLGGRKFGAPFCGGSRVMLGGVDADHPREAHRRSMALMPLCFQGLDVAVPPALAAVQQCCQEPLKGRRL